MDRSWLSPGIEGIRKIAVDRRRGLLSESSGPVKAGRTSHPSISKRRGSRFMDLVKPRRP